MKPQLIQNVSTYQQVVRKCTVIQFPNRKPITQNIHKTPSMGCCKTDMIDWNFKGF